MPKHLALLVAVSALALCSCTSLSHLEQREYKSLEHQGISLKHPVGDYKPPNNAILAGALNILPGFGNFYLALGHGSDGVHAVYGLVNLLFWPISIVWGVPEAAYDAIQLNKSDMIFYYRYSPDGKKALEELGIHLE
ncbi:MAG: hypothetical protein II943_00085 [Victivallales bacterium]|nr:hypothetical protein [Victivallales bacterium]